MTCSWRVLTHLGVSGSRVASHGGRVLDTNGDLVGRETYTSRPRRDRSGDAETSIRSGLREVKCRDVGAFHQIVESEPRDLDLSLDGGASDRVRFFRVARRVLKESYLEIDPRRSVSGHETLGLHQATIRTLSASAKRGRVDRSGAQPRLILERGSSVRLEGEPLVEERVRKCFDVGDVHDI